MMGEMQVHHLPNKTVLSSGDGGAGRLGTSKVVSVLWGKRNEKTVLRCAHRRGGAHMSSL